ncbi:MarR family transcriptional regulator [Maricaulis sp.]|uniref:MarR family transcriptional regulator n=1 Tax=Maricaulis sp. TaxID=1486257 RepID=UPI003A93D057
MPETPFFDGRAAFALRVKQLLDRLSDQMEVALQDAGLEIRGKATGIVQFLHHQGPSSLAEIAAELRYSHQLCTQRVGWLVEHGFAVLRNDDRDRRRRRVELTPAGQQEAEKLQAFLPALTQTYDDLFAEVGLDLHAAILAANAALDASPLSARMPPLAPAASSH